MSLSTLLEKLTAIVSKSFVLAWFLPTLIFGFCDGVLLYFHVPQFKAWADGQLAGPRAFDLSVLVVGLCTVAYLLSAVGGWLREVLEGRHFFAWWEKLDENMRARQQGRRNHLRAEYENARANNRLISDKKAQWRERLQTSAAFGVKKHPQHLKYPDTQPAAVCVAGLRKLRDSGKVPVFKDLAKAVPELCQALEANDASGENELSADYETLIELFDYAQDNWWAAEVSKLNQMECQFGSTHYVAPTAMGNVAESMQNYALTRYQLDLDTYWPRLQAVIQNIPTAQSFFGTLQDAKIQLDFLVACCWLTILTVWPWVFVLLFLPVKLWVFLLVALGSPLLAYFFYALAVKNCAALAILVNSAVDLYRFQLLEALHLPAPKGSRQERALWRALRRTMSFGNEVDISFKPDTKAPGA